MNNHAIRCYFESFSNKLSKVIIYYNKDNTIINTIIMKNGLIMTIAWIGINDFLTVRENIKKKNKKEKNYESFNII